MVFHFSGGSIPVLVTCVVGETLGWDAGQNGGEMRRGENPCGLSPLLSEFAKIRRSATGSQLLLRGCWGTAVFDTAAPDILELHRCESFPLSDGIGCPKAASAVTGDR